MKQEWMKGSYCGSKLEYAVHVLCSATFCHTLAASTIASASSLPNPNLWLKWNPAPFFIQPSSTGDVICAVFTIKCCKSLQVSFGLGKNVLLAQQAGQSPISVGPYNVFLLKCFREWICGRSTDLNTAILLMFPSGYRLHLCFGIISCQESTYYMKARQKCCENRKTWFSHLDS